MIAGDTEVSHARHPSSRTRRTPTPARHRGSPGDGAQALRLARDGWTHQRIAEALGKSPRTIQQWVWDQAGFHTARQLKPPPNLTLIPLPPYCPELNPIENLWHYLRSHHWSNHAFDDYDALRRAGCEAWHAACLNPERIKTVCRCGYIL